MKEPASKATASGNLVPSSSGTDPSISKKETPTAAKSTAADEDAAPLSDLLKEVGIAHSTYGDAVGSISVDIAKRVRVAAEAYRRAHLDWWVNQASQEPAERALREYQVSAISGWQDVGALQRTTDAYRSYRQTVAGILSKEGSANPAVACYIAQSLAIVADYQTYLNAIAVAIPKAD